MRWLGGKWKLSEQIGQHVPEAFGAYHEPMFGSGAMLLRLVKDGRMAGREASLSDCNIYLVRAWRGLVADPEGVKRKLFYHAAHHCYGHFLTEREKQEDMLRTDDMTEAAAWFLYLNRASYNGLWRARRDGKLNIPWGKKSAKSVQNFKKLDAAVAQLRDASIEPSCFHCRDVLASLDQVQQGDCAYVDPPYVQTFSGYNADTWEGEGKHRNLIRACVAAWKRGATVIVSQSAAASVVYDFEMSAGPVQKHDITAYRSVSCDASTRGTVTEHLYVLDGGTQ
jgi:DNA adenine methylase